MRLCHNIYMYYRNKKLNRKKLQTSKHDAILKSIEEHDEVTEKANQAIDMFLAAMDGESKWFECTCKEIDTEEKLKRSTKKNDCSKPFANTSRSHNPA